MRRAAGRKSVQPGQQACGHRQNALGGPAPGRRHDLAGGPLRADGAAGQVIAEGEPNELAGLVPLEECMEVGAGAEQARNNGGDGDAVALKLRMQPFRQPGCRELGGGIRQQMRERDFAADGRNVDDPARFAGLHLRQHSEDRV